MLTARNKRGEVFLRGPLYQVVRRDLARQLCTTPDEISASLTWLKALGVTSEVVRSHLNEDGQPCGKEVFEYPIMATLQKYLYDYRTTRKTPSPLAVTPQSGGLIRAKSQPDSLEEPASLPERRGDNLNCAVPQQILNESGGEAGADGDHVPPAAHGDAMRSTETTAWERNGGRMRYFHGR